MSQFALLLQEPAGDIRPARSTVLGLLREHMDGVDGTTTRRRNFKQRLGFKIGCCGATWGFRPTTIDDEDDAPPDPGCWDRTPRTSGMNLAAALAAERHFRASHEPEESGRRRTGESEPGTPLRVSLMRLLEEALDGGDEQTVTTDGDGGGGNDTVCCVCMRRRKGAAFIPCGHTFCRVCSRELWLNRSSCPLCNRPILEILDIF